MARTFHVRPSELLGVRDSFLAFCIDRAVWTFGTAVDTDMDAAQNDRRLGDNPKREVLIKARETVFLQYMNINGDETSPSPTGRFADPMDAIRAQKGG